MTTQHGAAVLAAGLALAGVLLTSAGMRARAHPPVPPAVVAAPAGATAEGLRPATTTASGAPTTALAHSLPATLDIPAIGVHTRLIQVGMTRRGTIEVPPPSRNAPAGWYKHSPTPGENGASVVVGHVDSAHDGPAVFYRLGELRPGDVVSVVRADGKPVTFRVTAVRLYPKNDFPTADVYGPVDHPGLRLITCGGSFDRVRRAYRSNVVVFARRA